MVANMDDPVGVARALVAMLAVVAASAGGVGCSAGSEPRRGVPRMEQVFVVASSGGSPRQLTHDRFAHHMPVWSPDGRLVADSVWIGRGPVVELLSSDGALVRRLGRGEAPGLVAQRQASCFPGPIRG